MSLPGIRNHLLALLLAAALAAGPAWAGPKEGPLGRVDDFDQFPTGSFPTGWKARGGSGAEVYRINRDEEAFLAARSKGDAVAIAQDFKYSLSEYPILSWEWRALKLPAKGDERTKATNDSAAAIYVVFKGWFNPLSIKYVWSTTLAAGTLTESPYNSQTKIVVLESGPAKLGQWISEKVNVLEDYRRLFGQELESVQAIGLMTDSDNTNSTAEADYRRLEVGRSSSPAGQESARPAQAPSAARPTR